MGQCEDCSNLLRAFFSCIICIKLVLKHMVCKESLSKGTECFRVSNCFSLEVGIVLVAKGLGVNGEQTGESEDWRAGDRNENNAERMR